MEARRAAGNRLQPENILIHLRTIAASAAVSLFVAPAVAQEPGPAAESVTVTEEHLRGFARAVIDLSRIQQELAPRIQAADSDEQESIRRQAAERMTAAVQRQGLDPQTFNAISQAAEQDEQLVEKIQTYVREEAEGR